MRERAVVENIHTDVLFGDSSPFFLFIFNNFIQSNILCNYID